MVTESTKHYLFFHNNNNCDNKKKTNMTVLWNFCSTGFVAPLLDALVKGIGK